MLFSFLDVLVAQVASTHDILLVVDGASNHHSGHLIVSRQHQAALPAPERTGTQPKENLWEEIREKSSKNYALKSMDAVRQKLKEAVLYIERNPKIVKSISPSRTSQSHSDLEVVSVHPPSLSGRWVSPGFDIV